MKSLAFWSVLLLILLVVVLAAYPFIGASRNTEEVTGLPWQVAILPDGSSQVFGLTIGRSKLSDALETLGNDMELAIVVATDADMDEVGNLEMYYGHYKAGLLAGKLVLQTSVSEQKIKQWRDNAIRFEYMATGLAKKHMLSPDDLPDVMQQSIVGITFIPAVNLDEKVILARFGEPDQRIELVEVTHFLYPQMGLDIAQHDVSKEVLQYVSPAEFKQLVKPLIQSSVQP